MKEVSLLGIIYAEDKLKIKYSVSLIEQISFEDGTFKYIFKPFYNVIDLLNPSFFQGIPGLNLDSRKIEYIRSNKTPTFIYERTPQENREDLWELLEEVDLKYLDKLEWLIRTDKIYTGDSLTVGKYIAAQIKNDCNDIVYGDKIVVDSISNISNNNFEMLKKLLKIITLGAYLESKDFNIDDSNRHEMYILIYHLYKNEYLKRKILQKSGIEKARSNDVYRGRKKIKVSIPKLEEVIERLELKDITPIEAMEILGLKSKRTLYRRIKEFKDEILNEK